MISILTGMNERRSSGGVEEGEMKGRLHPHPHQLWNEVTTRPEMEGKKSK